MPCPEAKPAQPRLDHDIIPVTAIRGRLIAGAIVVSRVRHRQEPVGLHELKGHADAEVKPDMPGEEEPRHSTDWLRPLEAGEDVQRPTQEPFTQ